MTTVKVPVHYIYNLTNAILDRFATFLASKTSFLQHTQRVLLQDSEPAPERVSKRRGQLL